MTTALASSNWKRRTNLGLVVVFMVLLWLPAADTFWHFDHSSLPGENRLAAEFPKYQAGAGGLKGYIQGLEEYFNDHFGLRKFLIWAHRFSAYHVFGDQSGRHLILPGRDGWLYFNENQMVEHYRGTLRFTPEELQDWKTLLERYRDWLAQRGIQFLFVVVPDKQTIYPEPLPAWMNKVSPTTKTDQFFAFMKAHSTVPVVDVRQTLSAGRALQPVYFKTDSHWNQLGAFLAYQRLVDALGGQIPGIKSLSLDAFERSTPVGPPGDLTAMAGVDWPESNAVVLMPKPPVPPLETLAPSSLTGARAATRNPNAPGCAIVYGDSFSNHWIPFLGYHFGQVSYFNNRFLEANFMDARMLDQQRPTVVILEVVERAFNVAKPKALLAKEEFK